MITECIAADGCCAGGCNANTDDDCEPQCGNDAIEAGEKCDGADCPTTCEPTKACESAALAGDAGECTAECTFADITECANGDGCCVPGCNANTDDDCAPECGNGATEPGETCDGDCPTDCQPENGCQTASLEGTAAGCDAECTFVTVITECLATDGCCAVGCNANIDDDCSPDCGNGVKEPGELCDGGCPTECTPSNSCETSTLQGDPAECLSQCAVATITACISFDGCCPAGCADQDDTDCPGG